jgi:excisionase family DNA binding protein
MTRLDAAVAELVEALRAELAAAHLDPSADGPERLLSVDEAADRLGIGRSSTYDEMNAGRLLSLKVGRRRLIAPSTLGDYIRARGDAARPVAPGTGGLEPHGTPRNLASGR